MSRPARMLLPSTQRRAEQLGARIRAARRRRRMSEAEMAERAFITRPTLRKLESGDFSVSLSVLAGVLEILGLDRDLDSIAAQDDIGHQLLDARNPGPDRRARN